MNIYFLDPKYVSTEKFPILLDILKVKRVIDLIEPTNRDMGLFNAYGSIAFFIRIETNIEFAIKNAVYKFNEQMCEAVIENGKTTGKFIVNDLYSKSSAYNPIYNLETCNDDNTLVLFSTKENQIPLDFSRYSLNLLNKYAGHVPYKNRICFCTIDCLLNFVSMLYEDNFYSIRQRNPLAGANEFYNPLLSYIELKLNELFPSLYDKIEDINHFFLSNIGIQTMNKFFEYKFNELRGCYRNYDNDNDYDEDDRADIDSDLEYLGANGGDWFFD